MDDRELIQNYAANRSETAFGELVARHLNHVHTTAFRQVRNSQLAEDITQAVFILLARKAAGLPPRTILAGWLYRTTRFVAARALRAEQRRKQREAEAFQMQQSSSPDQNWQRLTPLLDEALEQLGELERNALLLRFFQEKHLETVGRELGLSEEAARKRVVRSLEKLRAFFSRRGVTVSTAALTAVLAHHAAEAAPSALGSTVAAAAFAQAASLPGGLPWLVQQTLRAWKWTRLKIAVGLGAAVLVLALLAKPFIGVERPPRNAVAQIPAPAALAPASPAEGTVPSSEPASAAGTFAFRAIDTETGRGIAGARILAVTAEDQDHIQQLTNLMTDAEGRCNVPLTYSNVMLLAVGVIADGYEERCFAGFGGKVPAGYELKLFRGSHIGGVVQDEAGNPIAGVGIYVQFYGTGDAEWRDFQPERPGFPADDIPIARTDESGHWTFGSAPATNGGFWLDVKAPDFPKASFHTDADGHVGAVEPLALADLHAGKAILVLKSGLRLHGLVTDESNRPIGGAKVSFETSAPSSTAAVESGADGSFELKSLPAGQGHLLVMGDGFSPERLFVELGPTNPPTTVQLKPGALLRLRVVDETGAGIEHARVQLQGWRGYNTLDWGGFTDGEGRIEWTSAPHDELDLTVLKEGYFFSRGNLMRADGEEHQITLRPQMLVSGLVTDADTKQPIARFKVIPGSSPEQWQRINAVPGTNGQYQLALNEDKPPFLIRFEADGYEPAISEPLSQAATQVTYNIELQRPNSRNLIQGVVLLPDGSPAGAAQLALCTADKGIALGRKKFINQNDAVVVETDAAGRFQFPPQLAPHTLVAIHDQGFAQTAINNTNRTLSLQLQTWGRIEGSLKLRNGQNTGRQILLSRISAPLVRGAFTLDLSAFTAKTDQQGNFVFDYVPPGDLQLYVFLGMGIPWSHQTPVQVTSGATVQAQIGGTGRTVIGQLAFPDKNRTVNWANQTRFLTLGTRPPRLDIPQGLTREEMQEWQAQYWQSEEGRARSRAMCSFPLEIQPDGSFTIEDVPPGAYHLSGDILDSPVDRTNPRWFEHTAIGSIQQEVTVPDSTNDSAASFLDLGTLSCQPALTSK